VSKHNHLITYTGPTGDDTPDIILEQVPWDEYVGRVTIGTMVEQLKALLYGYKNPDTYCGVEDGQWEGQLNVYPRTKTLPYNLGVSHGVVGVGVVEEFEHTENIVFNLTATASLTYFAQEVVAIEWITSSYDSLGSVIKTPVVEIAGNTVTLSEVAYCTLTVTYSVYRLVHTVTVPERENAEENKYTSVAYAHYDGGVVWEELEQPANADIVGNCGYDQDAFADCDPAATIADKYTVYNYCSNEVLSDEYLDEEDIPNPIC
jgi:hypothetical protein